ncbi:MAG TPA: hypothetical protein VG867_07940 [Rhizomicrobium sp.]|nr:hypothetical protein [Rhizomicrobium sp.]
MALPQPAQHTEHQIAERKAPQQIAGAHIARLALLHDEARETAILANLLGRTPYAASVLAAGAIATALFLRGTTPPAECGVWLVLMLLGPMAMLRNYARAIDKPFERGSLREFAYDLNAIVIYAGFAWGAGAFLALAPDVSPFALAAFAAIVPAAIAVTLRTREIALGFLAPVATLCAFAAVIRPLPEGPLASAFVLIAAACVAGATLWADRLFAPSPLPANLARTPLAQP